jgi:hypothetical protein
MVTTWASPRSTPPFGDQSYIARNRESASFWMHPIIFAGFLPTVCHLAAVAFASYCLSSELHLVYCLVVKETGTKYRGLAPHKITPIVGRTAPEPAAGSVLKSASIAPAR